MMVVRLHMNAINMRELSMGGMMKLDSLKRNECSCKVCRGLCLKTPGWFLPQEIPLLAKYLELTIKETFEKYLIADIKGGWECNVYVLTPVKNFEGIDKDEEGMLHFIEEIRDKNKKMGWDCDRPGAWTSVKYVWIGAPCIFFKDSKCEVHSVKPFECSVTNHDLTPDKIRTLIAKEWSGSKLVKELLNGNEPPND